MKRRSFSGIPEKEAAMKKFNFTTREIGTVHVFDLEGNPTSDTIQDVAWRIQKNIRRYRLQRIILNLQGVQSLDTLGMRKILAACIRPQRSLIYGASSNVVGLLEDAYIPKNVRICTSEREVAEDLGPFLLEKEENKRFEDELAELPNESIGYQFEKRRSKRMHVAIPLELKIIASSGSVLTTQAIATNISEGGFFAEYLDLEIAKKIDHLNPINGLKVDVTVFPSANFPEEYQISGHIVRKELRKKQLGLGIKFDDGHNLG